MKYPCSSAFLCGLMILTACSPQAPQLQTFNTVPDFTLTAETGVPFHSVTELKGKVWLADFIFTTCMGPCLRMSSQMKQVQAATHDLADLRLVSFTVDPANDTPEALAGYAKRYGARPGRWIFLTGPPETLHSLSMDTFMLGKVDGRQMDHSTRFVLVDRKGRVRKYYATTEGFEILDLVRDVKALLKESA
jgi:protein SCO1/2